MEVKKIKLTKGLWALVDEADYDRVNAFKWCASLESRGTKYYAIRWIVVNGKRTKIRMHRFVLDLPIGSLDPDFVVHHKNDDGLDNRRGNLERISQEDNMNFSQGWKRQQMKRTEEPVL